MGMFDKYFEDGMLERADYKIFKMKTMKVHPSLVPIVGITGLACGLCGSYITYMCVSKGDFSFKPWAWNEGNPPYQSVKPTEIKKMWHSGRKFEVNQEVADLRKEIHSYKA